MGLSGGNIPALLAQLGKMFGGLGGPMAGAPGSTTSGSAARTPGPLPSPQVPAPQGSITANALPSMSSGAQPVLPRAAQSSPAYQSGFQFQTPKARNAAVVTNMMESLGKFAEQAEQKKYEKQVEEARGVVSTMLRMGVAADNSNDPDAKKLLQQKANEMLGAKEAAKILKDINKPGSAAYFGAQAAYKDVMAENQQKWTQKELEAKVAEHQATAQAETARAGAEQAKEAHERKLTEQAGQVTPEKKAELQQKNDQAALAAKTVMQHAQLVADTSVKTTKMRVDAIKAAKGGDDKTLSALAKEYTNLSTQFQHLGTQAKDLQKDLDDHPIANWWNGNEAQQKKNQISGIQAQQQLLTQQMQTIEQKRQVLQQHGLINIDTENPAGGSESVSDDEILKLLNQ